MTATRLGGRELADVIRADALDALDALRDRGLEPTLGTVLVSDDPAQRSFMDRKHELCADHGIDSRRVDLPADAPPADCHAAVERLADDDAVTALFVQVPLPPGVDEAAVRARIPPAKDVDCLAHENVGRFVAGDPRVRPVTTEAVRRLLDAHGVETAGRHAVVVGRGAAIGRPLAVDLAARDGGNATVTVCHTATRDLGAVTRRADLLVTAAGSPELVDASMVAEGTTVVDVSANRVDGEVVGDVAPDVRETAAAVTPVPGGVGPVTLAVLVENLVAVTARGAGVDPTSLGLPPVDG